MFCFILFWFFCAFFCFLFCILAKLRLTMHEGCANTHSRAVADKKLHRCMRRARGLQQRMQQPQEQQPQPQGPPRYQPPPPPPSRHSYRSLQAPGGATAASLRQGGACAWPPGIARARQTSLRAAERNATECAEMLRVSGQVSGGCRGPFFWWKPLCYKGDLQWFSE